MLTRFLITGLFSAALSVSCGSVVLGQSFPTKPLRIVSADVGGGSDFVARIVANAMSTPLGEQVIVENRPARLIGGIVAKETPDGYTMLLAGSTFLYAPLFEKTDYDVLKDFSPVSLLAKAPDILLVNPSVPVKSVKELIALAKTKPGTLNYASGGTGSSLHLAGELFKQMAGVNIVRVAYRGSGPAINAVMGGQVQVIFATAAAAASHLKSGKLRALAVTGLQPSALAPGLPTVASSGLPGYEMETMYAIVVPAKTPARIIRRLNRDTVQALNEADVKQKFFHAGLEAMPSSPKELSVALKTEIAKITKLIKDAGIKVN